VSLKRNDMKLVWIVIKTIGTAIAMMVSAIISILIESTPD